MGLDLENLQTNLNVIKPSGDSSLEGTCLANTVKATICLLSGEKPVRLDSNTYYDNKLYSEENAFNYLANNIDLDKTDYNQNIGMGEEVKNTRAFWETILNSEPGTVFIIGTAEGDHFYNIVFTEDERLYLIDSDAYHYKEIIDKEDLVLNQRDLEKIKNIAGEYYKDLADSGLKEGYNYVNTREGSLTIYNADTLNPKWQIQENVQENENVNEVNENVNENTTDAPPPSIKHS